MEEKPMPVPASAAHSLLLQVVTDDVEDVERHEGPLTGADLRSFAESHVDRVTDQGMAELRVRFENELPISKKNRDANRRRYAIDVTASLIDDLGLVAEALLGDVIGGDVDGITDDLHQTVADILQAGVTTTYAIALLLEHGYVIDADARWRGLYELACQTAVMAQTSNYDEAALRYLVHGGRIPEYDPRARAVRLTESTRIDRNGYPIFAKAYQWIPGSYFPGAAAPKNITQTDLFDYANLQSAPRQLVDQSHKAVHMSSLAVATEKTTARGAMPGGYDEVLEANIAERTAKTLYELVAHCCLLAAAIAFPPRTINYPAWERMFHERASSVVNKVQG
jgi:hypothetical protein